MSDDIETTTAVGWKSLEKKLQCSKCKKGLALECLKFKKFLPVPEGHYVGVQLLATCPWCGQQKYIGYKSENSSDLEKEKYLPR